MSDVQLAPDIDDLPEVMVKAEQVRKAFGRNQVLRGIDFEVHKGEVACIIGPSGGGKSTFLRCINHLEKIDAGRLSVEGELIGYTQRGAKLHEMKDREVADQRRAIGMVFQRFNLFPHMTAAQNIMAGPVSGRSICSLKWGWATAGIATRCNSRVDSSNGSRSRVRWRWTPT